MLRSIKSLLSWVCFLQLYRYCILYTILYCILYTILYCILYTILYCHYCQIYAGTIIAPSHYLSGIIELCHSKRGEQREVTNIDQTRLNIQFLFPLNEIVTNFYDELKSISSGELELACQASLLMMMTDCTSIFRLRQLRLRRCRVHQVRPGEAGRSAEWKRGPGAQHN